MSAPNLEKVGEGRYMVTLDGTVIGDVWKEKVGDVTKGQYNNRWKNMPDKSRWVWFWSTEPNAKSRIGQESQERRKDVVSSLVHHVQSKSK